MRVVAAHENPDLGSMALAGRIFPGSVLALVGGVEGPLKEILPLLEDRLDLLPVREIPLGEVILVDNAHPRIGPLRALLGRVPFLVFDHHPPAPGDVPAVGGRAEAVRATVSLLVPLLRERGPGLTPLEATLAYAGIYEDTGGFSFPSTTPMDLEAALFLLQGGAEVGRVRAWVRPRFSPEAQRVLQGLLETARTLEAQGFRLLFAEAREEGYIPALAPLAHTLLDLLDGDGILLKIALGREILLIARSRARLDVARWLREVGGGGHERAAFARIREEGLVQGLLASWPRYLGREPTLGEAMTQPVATLPPTTVEEALRLLEAQDLGAMPVVREGEVLGLARRRDLRKALRLGLGDHPVAGFLHKAVILPPSLPLSQVKPYLREGGSRVLVGEGGKLLGIYTCTDRYRQPPRRDPPLGMRIWEGLPESTRQVLSALKEAFPQGIYLVGGTLRDALLGRVGPDLDLALEGVRAEGVARFLVERFGGSLSLHPAFGTAEVRLGLGLKVDLAETREETYPYPGALPQVRPAPLQKDLARRDYTVNAMALSLGELELVDPFGGLMDLRRRLLRPLHPLAFVEDPSRIVRGARLAARLGFGFAEEALKALPEALKPGVVERASRSRLKDELLLTLAEEAFYEALVLLETLGALRPLYGLTLPPKAPFQALRGAPPEARLLLLLALQEDPLGRARALGLSGKHLQALALLAKGSFLEEDKEALGREPLRSAFLALYPEKANWLRERRPFLRGRDLLALGLRPGPQVGAILKAVAEARARGEVRTFEEELALARKLVGDGTLSPPE